MRNLLFLIIGTLFGIILIKGEVVSWFRIQEMFHFQSFHMYGVIGSAVMVGVVSVQLIKRFQIKSIQGETINLQQKPLQWKAQLFGGILFGFGWAMTGACPAPIYALFGAGYLHMVLVLLSAILGVWVYARFMDKLPH
jgi:uncharacterized membrane protein YedE/YeeE